MAPKTKITLESIDGDWHVVKCELCGRQHQVSLDGVAEWIRQHASVCQSSATQEMRVPAPCYFMVVDILGFSEIIKNLDGDEQNQRVVSWLDLVETTRHQVGVKDTQLISDTLFVREEDSIEGLAQLLRFAQLLLERGLERNFPLRGAIVHGDAAWGRLTYGKAVIEAHQMERSLDWIGVACERNLPGLNQLWDWDVVVQYPVPKKTGLVELMGAVAWNVPGIDELFLSATDKGLVDESDFATWGPIAKIERTIQFGMYLTMGKSTGADPKSSPGWFPMHVIDQSRRIGA